MSTAPTSRRAAARRRAARGFTLPEIMVAAGLASLLLVAVMTTYVISVKGFRAIANYAEIHSDGRLAIDRFARDMRAVSSISSYSASSLVVVVPTAFSSTGSVISNKTVTYSVSSNTLRRTDSATGENSVLANNIYQLTFSLYDKLGQSTTVLGTAKGVQVDIRLRKYVISQIQSEDYLSARLDMRNKP